MYNRNCMKIYIICPVRNVTEEQVQEIANYVASLELDGHQVHYPPRDVEQNDPTGWGIVTTHAMAMRNADRVDVFWDNTSKGSHADLGMAIIEKKWVKLVKSYQEDWDGKSYIKVMKIMETEYAKETENV